MTDRILVHADGGLCHGTPLENGWCPRCGFSPDTQSTELWTPVAVAKRNVERAIEFVELNGYADPDQCRLLVARIRELEEQVFRLEWKMKHVRESGREP